MCGSTWELARVSFRVGTRLNTLTLGLPSLPFCSVQCWHMEHPLGQGKTLLNWRSWRQCAVGCSFLQLSKSQPSACWRTGWQKRAPLLGRGLLRAGEGGSRCWHRSWERGDETWPAACTATAGCPAPAQLELVLSSGRALALAVLP